MKKDTWDEKEYNSLYNKLKNSKIFNREIDLNAREIIIYAAYLIGIQDALSGDADEYDLDPLEYMNY
jgi:hypothetical protein